MSLSGDVRYASRNARLFDDNIIIYIDYFILITHSIYNLGGSFLTLILLSRLPLLASQPSMLHKRRRSPPQKRNYEERRPLQQQNLINFLLYFCGDFFLYICAYISHVLCYVQQKSCCMQYDCMTTAETYFV